MNDHEDNVTLDSLAAELSVSPQRQAPTLNSEGNVIAEDSVVVGIQQKMDHPVVGGKFDILNIYMTNPDADIQGLSPVPVTNPTTRPTKWPRSDHKFVGRQNDLEKLQHILLDEVENSAKIAGIAGMGGIGKSTLAIRFIEDNQDKFPDGIIYLSIEHASADEIAQQFAKIAKIGITAGQSSAPEIMPLFREKRILLVLDNATSLKVTKDLLDDLFPNKGGCAVIVTSRNSSLLEKLVPRENRIAPVGLSKEEAKELLEPFLDVARVELQIEKLRVLVGGLPLALEIAGPYLQKYMSIEEYLTQLSDEKERLEFLENESISEGDNDEFNKNISVRASFRLSWKVLTDKQKTLFACLGACAHEGFSKRAALLASDQRDPRLLYTLCDLNLCIKNEGDHFALHPLLFAFAREQAEALNVLKLAKQRHTAYFVAFVQEHKAPSSTNFETLESELDALILTGMRLQDNVEQAVAFYMSLKPLLQTGGHWSKALSWMEMLLKAAEKQHNIYYEVFCRLQCETFFQHLARYDKVEQYLIESERLLEKVEDETKRKELLAMLRAKQGGVYRDLHKRIEAEKALKESLDLWQELGRAWEKGKVLNKLGAFYQSRDRMPEAEDALRESLAIYEQLHDMRRKSVVLNTLGGLYQKRKKTQDAKLVLEEALAIAEKLGDRISIVLVKLRLGGVYQAQGNKEKAKEVLQEALVIAEQVGNFKSIVSILNMLKHIYISENKAQDLLDKLDYYLEFMKRITYQDGVARLLNTLGELYLSLNQIAEAEAVLLESLKIARKSVDLMLIADVFTTLGQLYRKQRNRQKELEILQETIQFCRELDNKPGMEAILRSLGLFYEKQKWYEPASICLQKCFEIQEEERSPLIRKTTHILIHELQMQHKSGLAQQYCERALLVVPNDPELLKAYQRLCNSTHSAEELSNRLEAGDLQQDTSDKAIKLHKLGVLHLKEHRIDQAEEVFLKSLEIGRKLNLTKHIGIVLRSLGEVYARQGKVQKAEEALEESYGLANQRNDTLGMATVQGVRGKLLMEHNEFERACIYLQEGFALYEETQNSQGISLLHFLFKTLSILNREQELQTYLQHAIAIWPDSSDLRYWQRRISNRRQHSSKITGIIKRVIPSSSTKKLYGFIAPDDGGQDIYFGHDAVDSEFMKRLQQDIRVQADVQMVGGRPKAIRMQEITDDMQQIIRKVGRIKLLKPANATKPPYGFIAPDDGSYDIYFEQEALEDELMGQLQNGMRVWADIQMGEEKPRASVVGLEAITDSNNLSLFTILNEEDEKTLRRQLQSYEESGKESEKAQTLHKLGMLYQSKGRYDLAEKEFRKSLEIERKLENSTYIRIVLKSLAEIYSLQGNFQEAEKVLEESYTLMAQRDDKSAMVEIQRWRGKMHMDSGDIERASMYFQESFVLCEETQSKSGIKILYNLTRTLLILDRENEARDLWQRAKILWPEDAEMKEVLKRLEQEFSIALLQAIKRKVGYVKRITFDDSTGAFYGFIAPDDGSRDIYFVKKAVDSELMERLEQGMRVCADTQKIKGKPQALRVVEDVEIAPAQKAGSIKRLIPAGSSGAFYGFIKPDDGSQDIYFSESVVASELMGRLQQDMRVLADIQVEKKGTRAIRVVEEV